MRRRHIYIDESTGEALVMPVTPGSYGWENGISIEQLTIDALGDLNLAGNKRLDQRSFEYLFPARRYAFCEPEAMTEPFRYVEWFQIRAQGKRVLRFIVSGTPLNATVLVEGIKYGEDDGTNDVKATVILRQYRRPEVLTDDFATATATDRENPGAVSATQSYVVKPGDTLSAIALTFYGNASLYGKLAAANNISNPHLIYPGQVLTIPPVGELPPPAPVSMSAQKAQATTTKYSDEEKRWRVQLVREAAAQ